MKMATSWPSRTAAPSSTRMRTRRPSSGAMTGISIFIDRKSTRLNSSHTVIYTLSLHDALPIYEDGDFLAFTHRSALFDQDAHQAAVFRCDDRNFHLHRSEEHTSELQSHSDLHSFPTRRSSDL